MKITVAKNQASIDYLFVYGTLMQDIPSPMTHVMEQYTCFVSQAYVLGQLYEVHGYPALMMCEDCQNKVHGEIYRVLNAKKLFEHLDEYEQCSTHFPVPHEYERKQVGVSQGKSEIITAWTYVYNWPTANLEQITDGCYRKYRINIRN